MYQTLLILTFLSCLWTLYSILSQTQRFSDTATFMEVKLPRHLQESNPNLTNFVHTSYVRTPPCWFCRRDEVKHACTGACTRICPWQTATCTLLKMLNLFLTQKGRMKSWINADIALRVSHTVRWKKKFCVPQLPCKIDSRNFCPLWWNVQIVGIPVFLNGRATARYRAAASIIPGRERLSWNL